MKSHSSKWILHLSYQMWPFNLYLKTCTTSSMAVLMNLSKSKFLMHSFVLSILRKLNFTFNYVLSSVTFSSDLILNHLPFSLYLCVTFILTQVYHLLITQITIYIFLDMFLFSESCIFFVTVILQKKAQDYY